MRTHHAMASGTLGGRTVVVALARVGSHAGRGECHSGNLRGARGRTATALETLDVLIITAGRSAGSDGAFIRKFGDGVESTVSPLRKTSGNTLGQALAHLEPHVSTRYLNRGVLF